jgi:hypothetical protein
MLASNEATVGLNEWPFVDIYIYIYTYITTSVNADFAIFMLETRRGPLPVVSFMVINGVCCSAGLSLRRRIPRAPCAPSGSQYGPMSGPIWAQYGHATVPPPLFGPDWNHMAQIRDQYGPTRGPKHGPIVGRWPKHRERKWAKAHVACKMHRSNPARKQLSNRQATF